MALPTENFRVPAPPVFNFKHEPSVDAFTVSSQAYLASHPAAPFELIATGSLVIDTTTSVPRILLLQRAAHDSNPNKWEAPGGACDDEDESILHGAARELWEEARLEAIEITGLIGAPHVFTRRRGGKVGRFNFAVKVRNDAGTLPVVQLDPNEHQNFVWASEDEVKGKRVGDIGLVFTSDEIERTAIAAFNETRRESR